FETAFEGVCSLRDIGAVKTNKEIPLNTNEVKININELKAKLKKNTTTLINQYLYFGIYNMNIAELSWKNPLASQNYEIDLPRKLIHDGT
ncbi:8638_t:CDS:2, partial [Funneliformis geosporum]